MSVARGPAEYSILPVEAFLEGQKAVASVAKGRQKSATAAALGHPSGQGPSSGPEGSPLLSSGPEGRRKQVGGRRPRRAAAWSCCQLAPLSVLGCFDLLSHASATMVLVTSSSIFCRWLGSFWSLGARSFVLSQWSSSVLSCPSKTARSAQVGSLRLAA